MAVRAGIKTDEGTSSGHIINQIFNRGAIIFIKLDEKYAWI